MNFLKQTFFQTVICFLFLSISAQASCSLTTTPPEKGDERVGSSFAFYQVASSKKLVLKAFNSNYKVQIFNEDGKAIESYSVKKNSRLETSTVNIKPGKYFLRYISDGIYNNSTKILIIK